MSPGLSGVNLFDPGKPTVYICEGLWDAAALYEVLGITKESESGLTLTASKTNSLLASANVLASASANTAIDPWLPLLGGKHVVFLYDNDHPTAEGTRAGLDGMKRAAAKITQHAEELPLSVSYVRWGKDGHDPNLPSGFDVRDLLSSQGNTPSSRVDQLRKLLSLVEPVPDSWLEGAKRGSGKKGKLELECKVCTDWNTLVNAWRKAMKWTEGLDRALSVMLAVVTSTKAIGDQLWVKIIGPAACGKSTLCEALSVNHKYVTAKSTIRGFHSGFKSDADGREDNSLICSLYDKTLVTKDGDTLLQSPNLGQILSEARDIYDRTSRTHYRNKMGKDYAGINMTWLLCGTSSLRSIDSSELGERFLDCVIVEDIDEDLEDEIGWRVANRAEREMSYEADGKPETRDGPDYVLAKQLTGGYVDYLRTNAQSLLDQVQAPEWTLRRCQKLAKFVAFMRARPSTRQEEKAEREMSFRLISQLVRLAKCVAAVLNKREIDTEVMRRVNRVAMDTARGRVMELCRVLYSTSDNGMSLSALTYRIHYTEEKTKGLLQFLRQIGVVELYQPESVAGIKTRPLWRLTAKFFTLYQEIVQTES
jgi:energy-coupling factor transporter ATP-binding protein EcfA2